MITVLLIASLSLLFSVIFAGGFSYILNLFSAFASPETLNQLAYPLSLLSHVVFFSILVIARKKHTGTAKIPTGASPSDRPFDTPLGLPFWTGIITTTLAAFVFFRILYNPLFDGLVNTGGGDAFAHLGIFRDYSRGDVKTYSGFVNLFSTMLFFKNRIGSETFYALRMAFYASIAFLPAVLGIIAAKYSASIQWKTQSRQPLHPFFVLWIFLLPTLLFSVLPVIHMSQGSGFFSHLFGLAPLFAMWALYAIPSHPYVRAIGLAYGLFALRFSYGLNLGDAIFATAILLGIEAKNSTSRFAKLTFAIAAILALGAAGYSFHLLSSIIQNTGGYRKYVFVATFFSLVLCSAFLIKHINELKDFRDIKGTPENCFSFCSLKRFYIFAAAFGSTSTVATLAWYVKSGSATYYIQKYPVYAAIVLCLATSFALAERATNGATNGATCRTKNSATDREPLFENIQNTLRNLGPWKPLTLTLLFFLIVFALNTTLSAIASGTAWAFAALFFAIVIAGFIWGSANGKVSKWVWLGYSGYTLFFVAWSPYFNSVADRVRTHPPFEKIDVLFDLPSRKIVQNVLRDENAKFGGLLTSDRLQTAFANTLLERLDFADAIFTSGKMITPAIGECLFWFANQEQLDVFSNLAGVRNSLKAFLNAPETRCLQYERRWMSEADRKQRICYFCKK